MPITQFLAYCGVAAAREALPMTLVKMQECWTESGLAAISGPLIFHEDAADKHADQIHWARIDAWEPAQLVYGLLPLYEAAVTKAGANTERNGHLLTWRHADSYFVCRNALARYLP